MLTNSGNKTEFSVSIVVVTGMMLTKLYFNQKELFIALALNSLLAKIWRINLA